MTPSLSASGARKARVLPTSLLVVLPNNLLVGRNNLTLVTPIILRYRSALGAWAPPVTGRGPALSRCSIFVEPHPCLTALRLLGYPPKFGKHPFSMGFGETRCGYPLLAALFKRLTTSVDTSQNSSMASAILLSLSWGVS